MENRKTIEIMSSIIKSHLSKTQSKKRVNTTWNQQRTLARVTYTVFPRVPHAAHVSNIFAEFLTSALMLGLSVPIAPLITSDSIKGAKPTPSCQEFKLEMAAALTCG